MTMLLVDQDPFMATEPPFIAERCQADSVYGHECGLDARHQDETHLCCLPDEGEGVSCGYEWRDEDEPRKYRVVRTLELTGDEL